MKTFKKLFEKIQLTHLEHLEDEIINNGISGGINSIKYLKDIYDELHGNVSSDYVIQMKMDGAPSIVSGYDPENGKFFVGTKSLFNKEPKVNYTPEDVKRNHGHSAGLTEKLISALKYLPSCVKKGEIIQGDFLYTKSDLKTDVIDGVKCIVFTPNTITYAVPLDTKLASTIKASQMGVVWHTSYSGNSIKNLSASLNISESQFKRTKDVYCRTTNVQDITNLVKFTKDEDTNFKSSIKNLETSLKKFNTNDLQEISSDNSLKTTIKTYINQRVRDGKKVSNNEIKYLIDFINTKHEKAISKLKTDKSKDKKTKEKDEFINKIRGLAGTLYYLFWWSENVQNLKNILIQKLEKFKAPETPYIFKNGRYTITNPEGFVLSDGNEKGVKFVNRDEFSRTNMLVGKFNK